jgi:hypothetical protein
MIEILELDDSLFARATLRVLPFGGRGNQRLSKLFFFDDPARHYAAMMAWVRVDWQLRGVPINDFNVGPCPGRDPKQPIANAALCKNTSCAVFVNNLIHVSIRIVTCFLWFLRLISLFLHHVLCLSFPCYPSQPLFLPLFSTN